MISKRLFLGVVLCLTACTGQSSPVATADAGSATAVQVLQAGAPGDQPRSLTADEVAALELPVHTPGDVAFVRDMLHHHAQALEMTALLDERADSDRLRLLAERMDISQDAEIEAMESWLAERGETVDDHHAGMAHDMPGILTGAQMQTLADAEGPAFDLLFLELMTLHHEGALEMVADLWAREDGSGQDIGIFHLASHIDSDQRIEIERMADLDQELRGQ